MLSIQIHFLALFLLHQTAPWTYTFLNQKCPSDLALMPVWGSASSTIFLRMCKTPVFLAQLKGLFKRKQLVRQCSLIQRNTLKARSMDYCWPPYSSAMPQAFSSVLWKRNIYWDVHIPLQTFLCETTRFFAFNCQNPGKSLLVQGNPDFTVQACTDMGHKQLWLSLSLTFWNNWCITILVVLDEI